MLMEWTVKVGVVLGGMIGRDYGDSFTTACKGGLTRSSDPDSPSLTDFLSAREAWTHSPNIVLLVSSI